MKSWAHQQHCAVQEVVLHCNIIQPLFPVLERDASQQTPKTKQVTHHDFHTLLLHHDAVYILAWLTWSMGAAWGIWQEQRTGLRTLKAANQRCLLRD